MAMTESDLAAQLTHLAVSLALGLLIGSERGWRGRERAEGTRSAGIRTFAIIALFGGIVATGVEHLSAGWPWLICVLASLAVAGLLGVSHYLEARTSNDLGLTTEFAALATYWLGVLPAFGLALPAAASAIVLTLLLHLKGPLHHTLEQLDRRELLGTLQFLLISVVLLPLLPNQGYGPFGAINPFRIWWMVVLISGLSLVGYFAMRVAGPSRGVVFTSLAGGLVSSTAVTLDLARLHRTAPDAPVEAGILIAWAMMFARILVVVSILNPLLLRLLAPALGAAGAVLAGAAWWYWRNAPGGAAPSQARIKNPFQLVPALVFAGLLAAVMIGSQWLSHWLGDSGLYLLSLATGLSDVDAIVLTLAPGAIGHTADVAVVAIAIAAATNTVAKACYSAIAGNRTLGLRMLPPAVLAGGAALGVGFAV